jgi:hypothetical protein
VAYTIDTINAVPGHNSRTHNVAIYSTFFVCKPNEVLSAFRGWKLPLPEPVRREVVNPFTRKSMTIESRRPDWPEADAYEETGTPREIVSIEGRTNKGVRNEWHFPSCKYFRTLKLYSM